MEQRDVWEDRAAALSPWWRGLWSLPNPALADAGARGEIVVAKGRLALTLLIVGIPTSAVLSAGWTTENVIAFAFAVFAALLAAAVYRVVSHRRRILGLPFATSIGDVTLISLVHASYLLAGLPTTAANSRTTFPIYLLAIAATALRWDIRVCVAAGAAAIVEYAAIAAVAWRLWSARPTPETAVYGEIVPGQQVARLILLVIATWLAVAIVRQSSTLRYSATHDVLSGLQNRPYFMERLAEELERAQRVHRPVAVAMLDLDHFKRVNDTWGHAAGDAALRAVAGALRSTARRTDLVARYGGEEFAMALPDLPAVAATSRLVQVLDAVRALAIAPASGAPALTVTISAGIASFPADGVTASDLLRVADERLLEAKRAGRDRIVAAGSG